MSKKIFYSGVAAAVAATLLLTGCGGGNKLKDPKDLGQSKVVEKSQKRPSWIGTSYKEKDDFIYFSGQVNNVADRSLGMRQAKADALQNLVESVQVKARSEFSEAIRGTNQPGGELGRYVDSLVAWTTENLNVSGAIPVEEYAETVRTRDYGGYEYTYNCYVWLRLSKDEYFRARQGAIDRASTEAQDQEAKELALEAKQKLSE